MSGDRAYGTADDDAPVTRRDLERALRNLNLSDLELRDAILQLGARVVALTDELTRRLDGVEPDPAPPGTPAAPSAGTLEAVVAAHLPSLFAQVRAADAQGPTRVSLDLGADKYTVEAVSPPCDELLPLCGARCCTFNFALSTADLDEGVIRWDYGQPYLIRQRASDGFCVHNDPSSRHCTVHAHRPRVCRTYDCTTDARIWLDYANRVPAPPAAQSTVPEPMQFDLMKRAQTRAAVIRTENGSVGNAYADPGPIPGPVPPFRSP